MIQYSEDSAQYIAHALSPAKVSGVKLDEANKVADVFVVPEQFSLAIGRSGQNVRLAAQLTGWKINVNEQGGENKAMSDEQNAEEDKKEDEAVEEEKTIEEKE